jgi:hypothetical protein
MYLIPHGGCNVACVQKSSVQIYFSFITTVLYQVSLILSLPDIQNIPHRVVLTESEPQELQQD